MLESSHDTLLVIFSVLIAILASYTALDLAGRITAAQGRVAHVWLGAGAVAMGLGIWSMHFVGMLAFQLPIPLGYDVGITVGSLVIAIVASAFALWLVCQQTLPWSRLVLGAVLMGCAVAGMHYTGMAAMRMRPGIDYDPLLFALSVAIAIGACGAALWIAFRLRHRVGRYRRLRVGAATVMGLAIVAMHYIGMAAAGFPNSSVCGAAASGLSGASLAVPIMVITISVLAVALITSVLDLRLAMQTAMLAESLAAANEELTYLALHDKLTKLPNRALLEDRFERMLQAGEGTHIAVLFVDLDGFKAVNDSLGHQAGDVLLAEVAQRLRAGLDPQATASRVGGDEFVLLSEVDEPEDAGAIAERVLTALRAPIVIGGQVVHVSASIGIAVSPDNGADQRTLLRHADAAMYHAKASGRDMYSFFAQSMQRNAQAQQSLVHELRGALQHRQFVLHYQPKVTAPLGTVVGAEALLRWNHPARGLIPPDHFIPLAEKTGMIVPIGKWVLDEACRQLAHWHGQGHRAWTMAVNLSAVQFCDPALIETVRDTLWRHGLEPQVLTLEITESTAMHDVEVSMAILQQLDIMGVRISIDDFGTGYSSLLHLKRIPASELKIDRAFVRHLAQNTDDAAIVSAIVALGHTLNLQIVAEGVETPAQQAFLTNLGCDGLQGYLLGRPVPADEFAAQAARHPMRTAETAD
ncbi:EAL domain-containing protein [Cupriavidus respiraculi]|uniref:putative bifunctional diguanylate cyclase/phosphodiesterase n=1 Tax=Cupriavidus respiraculi TaxID=195930 RepID=UPI001C972C5B|nr:EAL domain-containing protein [Cupriavidus respiraculi]MBY4947240.1 EAL domain-containing protein [Cupriavidus respiraculi]